MEFINFECFEMKWQTSEQVEKPSFAKDAAENQRAEEP
jgi:hypothetical protein